MSREFSWLVSRLKRLCGHQQRRPTCAAPPTTAQPSTPTSPARQRSTLTRLKALSDEHFNVAPDAVTWGDVGTLAHYAELLKRITDSAFKKGEHAE